MNIVDKCPKKVEEAETDVSDLRIGTVFEAKLEDCESIFLRTYDEIVDLNDPSNCWECPSEPTERDILPVSDFRELDVVLVIKRRVK